MANYANKEIELLGFVMIGSKDPNDPNPPFSGSRITWKGEIVPFVNSIEISCNGAEEAKIIIRVTTRKGRGYKKDDPAFKGIMRDMRDRGINIIGWPEPGDDD